MACCSSVRCNKGCYRCKNQWSLSWMNPSRRLREGILTRTQCLERYPEHRGELAVLLDAALILRSAKLPTPNQAYFRAGRARLVAKIEQEQQLTVVDRLESFFRHLSTNSFRLQTATIALLLAFLFVAARRGHSIRLSPRLAWRHTLPA
jgi:hypothetical protein